MCDVPVTEYRYREGVHSEHCIDYGTMQFVRNGTLARVSTKEEAERLIAELMSLRDRLLKA